MAEKGMATRKDDRRKPQTPFSLFPKFHIAIPFLNQPKRAESVVGKEAKPSVIPEEGESERVERENEDHRPNVVSFPKRRPIIPPSLDVEVEESSGRTQNPIVIWQVYALGGFFILKWVWARWKERKERAKKDDDNESHDEYQSPAEDGE